MLTLARKVRVASVLLIRLHAYIAMRLCGSVMPVCPCRSFDQFANLIMEQSVERIVVGQLYAEVALGLYVVRGENVVLLGEIDEARDPPAALRRVTHAEIQVYRN